MTTKGSFNDTREQLQSNKDVAVSDSGDIAFSQELAILTSSLQFSLFPTGKFWDNTFTLCSSWSYHLCIL
jgi:hypothetical protein